MPKETAARTDTTPLYPIASVDNALRLLLLFRDHRELRLSDAATHLGVANSTAHRLLAMLQHHGFVRQDARTRAYIAGTALLEVGLAVVRNMDIREIARPVLEGLTEATGETSHLAVLEHDMVRYLDAVESPKALRVTGRTGVMLPAHCTSIGKALLAELDADELRRLYPSDVLPAETDRSITSFAELVRNLAKARERGYAVNTGESEDGMTSVAVAVRDQHGTAFAAISAAGPSGRLPAKRVAETAALLQARAAELAELLGR